MALINCPHCNKQISDKAITCPHCNYALKKENIIKKWITTNIKLLIFIIPVILVISMLLIKFTISFTNKAVIINEFESAMETERYEQAFDIINNSDLSYDDKEHYRDLVIPYMKLLHEEVRNSNKENLAFILDDIEYYISEDKIYSKKDGDILEILYEVPDYKSNLRSHWSVYANGHLFFIEGYHTVNYKPYESIYKYTAKSLDLETGDVEILGSADSRGDVVKLESGCIFIGLNILDFNEGIWYNPYTESKYVGEDAVSDFELANAIYMN